MDLNADAIVWELDVVQSNPSRTNWRRKKKKFKWKNVRVSESHWNLKTGPLASLKISDAVVVPVLATGVASASSHPLVN